MAAMGFMHTESRYWISSCPVDVVVHTALDGGYDVVVCGGENFVLRRSAEIVGTQRQGSAKSYIAVQPPWLHFTMVLHNTPSSTATLSPYNPEGFYTIPNHFLAHSQRLQVKVNLLPGR